MSFFLELPLPPVEANAVAERELKAFEEFFTQSLESGGLGNPRLSPYERAILKTYLFARLNGRFSPPGETGTSAPAGAR